MCVHPAKARSSRNVIFVVLLPAVLAVGASSVDAQTNTPPQTTPTAAPPAPAQTDSGPRFFLRGLSGFTFGNTKAGATFAGSAAVALGSHVQIVGEAGRLEELLPKTTQADLNMAALTLGESPAVFGPITFGASQSASYGQALVRIVAPAVHAMIPYFEAGAGMARLSSSQLTAESGGKDESALMLSVVTLPAGETKPITSIGGGVSFAVRDRSAVDIGYRYGRILTDGPQLSLSRVYVGFRYAF